MLSQMLTALIWLVLGAASSVERRFAPLPPSFTVKVIGNQTSTIPNIYRDGGGGGKINGLNFFNYADGTTTTGGPPLNNGSNFKAFGSNSISYSEYNGGGPQMIEDFGTTYPKQQVPFFSNETDNGIWPSTGISTLCNGACGVAFYPVIDRSTCPSCKLLYNTGVNITVSGYGPVVSRPVQAMFYANEPQYGSFGSLLGVDGFLYVYAAISGTNKSNGLKMARVPSAAAFDRTQYQYWNGNAYQSTIVAADDNGYANIFNFSTTFYLTPGQYYGPSSGDLFFSSYYGVYMLIFGQSDGSVDNTAYMTYSHNMTGGWATPVSLYKTDVLPNGFNYNIHAYPDYDSTGKVIPISWTQYRNYSNPAAMGYYNAMANVTFS